MWAIETNNQAKARAKAIAKAIETAAAGISSGSSSNSSSILEAGDQDNETEKKINSFLKCLRLPITRTLLR